MSAPAAVVFDFDGVLIESTAIKTRALVGLFADYPEHRAAIERHHQDNAGISRYEKFAWIHRNLLGREITAEESADLGRRFSEQVFDAARGCPTVPGADRVLRRLAGARIPLWVASGTPQDELRRLVEARGWSRHFRGVFGSPTAKSVVLRRVASELAVPAERVVMVGDGRSDYRAAREVGAAFVLRETAAQARLFEDYDGPSVIDMVGLPGALGLPAGEDDG